MARNTAPRGHGGRGIVPVPPGLAPHAWWYFAIFAGVIAALVVEPLPSPAIGLIGVTAVTMLAPWVLFEPAEIARPDFKFADKALRWAFSGLPPAQFGWYSAHSCSRSVTRKPGLSAALRS